MSLPEALAILFIQSYDDSLESSVAYDFFYWVKLLLRGTTSNTSNVKLSELLKYIVLGMYNEDLSLSIASLPRG